MIKGSKICGISDLDTLNFIINHPYPPQFIGFICNYKKSSRYVDIEKLNKLLAIDKNKSNFVAVLVKPDEDILEKIKHLPFDYYQIYDCTPDEIKSIKKKYKNLFIVTPGIRLPGDSANDQSRVMTPNDAFKNKVSGIVMGRSLIKGNIKNNTQRLIDHLNK